MFPILYNDGTEFYTIMVMILHCIFKTDKVTVEHTKCDLVTVK